MEQKSTKWEYLKTQFDLSGNWVVQLNWQGHSDWELVQILTTEVHSISGYCLAIYKRPVLGDAAVGERLDHDEAKT